jgi:hypothetical protein
MLAIPLLVLNTLAAGSTAGEPFAQRPLLEAERARATFWPTIGGSHVRERRALRGRVPPPKGALKPQPRDTCPTAPDWSLFGRQGKRLDVRQVQCWIDSWGPAFILDGRAR